MSVRKQDGPILVKERFTSFALMERVAGHWDNPDGTHLTIREIPRLPKTVNDLDTAIIVLAHATIRFFNVERVITKARTVSEAKALIRNAGFSVTIDTGPVEEGSVLQGVLKLLKKMNVMDQKEEDSKTVKRLLNNMRPSQSI